MKSNIIKKKDFKSELKFYTSRSSGPGGQNVNKVSSKVELRFDIVHSQLLSKLEKEMLNIKLAGKINKQGVLIIVSQSERTQLANKNKTIEKFEQMIAKALTPEKRRKRSKKAPAKVKEKRLEEKRRVSEKKALRKFVL